MQYLNVTASNILVFIKILIIFQMHNDKIFQKPPKYKCM